MSRIAGKVVVSGAGQGHLPSATPHVAETPLGTGTLDEVAPLVLFLVSDESSFISGAEKPVDGGMTAHGGVTSISDAVRAATSREEPPCSSTSPTAPTPTTSASSPR